MRFLLALLTIVPIVACDSVSKSEGPTFAATESRSGKPDLTEASNMPHAIPRKVTDLAGFTLAHAVWNVSDTTPDELLCPLAFIEGPGGRTLTRYEADTQEVAIGTGKQAMADLTTKGIAWAFAREGTWRTPENSVGLDAIVVDAWAPGLSQPLSIVQLFQRASTVRGFRLGSAFLVVDGAPAEEPLATTTFVRIRAAVDAHPAVKDLWPQWQTESEGDR